MQVVDLKENKEIFWKTLKYVLLNLASAQILLSVVLEYPAPVNEISCLLNCFKQFSGMVPFLQYFGHWNLIKDLFDLTALWAGQSSFISWFFSEESSSDPVSSMLAERVENSAYPLSPPLNNSYFEVLYFKSIGLISLFFFICNGTKKGEHFLLQCFVWELCGPYRHT